MTEKYKRILSWEGATERLYKASAISKRDCAERRETGADQAYVGAAKFHIDTARRSQNVTDLISGKAIKKAVSTISSKSEKAISAISGTPEKEA